ncbi:methanobactin biosynthesis FAD monooxygenase MbnF [Methylocystis sp. B8]|uniref:methanobactin biosynthesis FAD monooxygenase MbnF n=1 Tax=Methylocystis sp. B8 TaxID=544938 RepID=UPI0010FF0A0F|nr:methanobactin biosynthesis FAD monooxygenase MbnF [Methylocystis sp. B8]TLG75532.1 FAD-binding protein [Methylocystis sp. B8]
MSVERIPVLIVGAGYAGLSAATLLAWRGVPCLLVEKRATTSRLPKAHGINRRSMEVLRVVEGLEDALFAASRTGANDSTLIIAESVTSPPIETLVTKMSLDATRVSPSKICTAGQDRVEPVLLRFARNNGADIRFSTTLAGFSQREDGVEAILRDEASGQETTVLADYMIAADGAGGTIRDSGGVKMEGPGFLADTISVLFETDLSAILPSDGFTLYYLRNPAFSGAFVTCDEPNHGQINIEYDSSRDQEADFDEERCKELVRQSVGVPDLAVKILDIRPWRMAALIADRMSFGRVFLAGDCAHITPPVGGLGGQTAIQDAADLAWKLALVVKGQAAPALLDSYEIERKPVARIAIARAIANYIERLLPDRQDLRIREDEYGLLETAMGYRYRSDVIIADEDDDGALVEDPFRPSGAPGTRLAHVWLRRGEETVSSHDLIGRDFMLFVGPDGGDWMEAAQRVGLRSRTPLGVCRVGFDVHDPEGLFLPRLGVSPEGALLVRPDGYIAWRSKGRIPDPLSTLESSFARAKGEKVAKTLMRNETPLIGASA